MSPDFIFLAKDCWCYNLLQPTGYMVQFRASIRVLKIVVFHQGVLVLHLASAKRTWFGFTLLARPEHEYWLETVLVVIRIVHNFAQKNEEM